MKIDIEKLKAFHKRNALVQGSFGDLKETACLMSALTRRTGFDGCVAEGWPRWLAELGAAIFDNAPPEVMWPRAIGFAEAVAAAEARGADWDQCFRDIRMRAILPIALDAVGEGDQPWRAECRRVIQWSIDRDGQAAEAAKAARAAEAAEAAGAAEAAEAAGAAWAAEAAEAAGAAWAAGAAQAAEAKGAKAWTRIYDTTVAVLRGDPHD